MEGAILVSAPSSPPSSTSIPSVILTQDEMKKITAYKAVEKVESGMVLGLGIGSTAKHAVDRIGDLFLQGKLHDIIGIPTSRKTHEQAVSVGIPLADLDSHPVIDLAIDGVDEVDPVLNLVKGRGGSLLREKMVEGACRKFVVIVDESKLVKGRLCRWRACGGRGRQEEGGVMPIDTGEEEGAGGVEEGGGSALGLGGDEEQSPALHCFLLSSDFTRGVLLLAVVTQK